MFEAPHESLALTVLNEIACAESARRRAEGITEFPTLQPGEAWIRIVRRPPVLFEQVRFVAEDLSSICLKDVNQTTVNGNPALDCGHLLWIQMPGGRLLSVSMANVGQDLETQNLLDAMLATITFHE